MGLLDKIKVLFVDEIEEEEEIEEEKENKKLYEEPKNALPKVMRDTIEKSEKVEDKKEEKEMNLKFNFDDIKKEKEPAVKETPKVETKKEAKDLDKLDLSYNTPKENTVSNQSKFNFPMDLEEDFVPRRKQNVNVLEKVKEEKKVEAVKEEKKQTLYPKKEVEKSKFKVSPVISPVYGILDKNYKKEEIVEKEEKEVQMKRPSKKVDFESVRKKAFGNLSDDIKENMLCEKCELYKEAKRMSNLKEDDLLYDMTVEDNEPVTLEKAYDNYEEFGVAYEANTKKKEDTMSLNQLNKINPEELPSRESKKVKEEETIKEETKKEIKVEPDFFELMDSMYKERSEEE